MKPPVEHLKSGNTRVNVLAVEKAIHAGALSAADRKTVEKFLPGLIAVFEKRRIAA
jgi:hypothetical protein